MKTFVSYLNESRFNEYLFEGIDINLKMKTVTFTDKHENYVDTSGKLAKKKIDGIDTYMLFKRKKDFSSLVSDGNPLVYALKNLNSWKITNKEELMKRIQDSIKQLPKSDIVIMVPSSNPLMKEISKYITSSGAELLESCLFKKTKEEVLSEMDFSEFTDFELDEIDRGFDKMGTYFESKHFPKFLLEKLSVSIFKTHSNYSPKEKKNNELAIKIKDKNILIIDDTISSGFSLSSCSKIIKEQYFPKNVFQFSLFSDLK